MSNYATSPCLNNCYCVANTDYPCPLWSVRSRPSVYGDIGHTIMNLLAVSTRWDACAVSPQAAKSKHLVCGEYGS